MSFSIICIGRLPPSKWQIISIILRSFVIIAFYYFFGCVFFMLTVAGSLQVVSEQFLGPNFLCV